MDGPSRKHKWTDEEDGRLRQLMQTIGASTPDWMQVAQQFPNRNAKQCRERWMHHLSPDVDKGPWSLPEELILFQLQAVKGNRWKEIAKYLPGRSDSGVKNRYYSALRRVVRRRQVSSAVAADLLKAHFSDGAEQTLEMLKQGVLLDTIFAQQSQRLGASKGQMSDLSMEADEHAMNKSSVATGSVYSGDLNPTPPSTYYQSHKTPGQSGPFSQAYSTHSAGSSGAPENARHNQAMSIYRQTLARDTAQGRDTYADIANTRHYLAGGYYAQVPSSGMMQPPQPAQQMLQTSQMQAPVPQLYMGSDVAVFDQDVSHGATPRTYFERQVEPTHAYGLKQPYGVPPSTYSVGPDEHLSARQQPQGYANQFQPDLTPASTKNHWMQSDPAPPAASPEYRYGFEQESLSDRGMYSAFNAAPIDRPNVGMFNGNQGISVGPMVPKAPSEDARKWQPYMHYNDTFEGQPSNGWGFSPSGHASNFNAVPSKVGVVMDQPNGHPMNNFSTIPQPQHMMHNSSTGYEVDGFGYPIHNMQSNIPASGAMLE